MPRRLPAFAALLAVLAGAGCALFAKRTPTPANDIDREELARRPPPPGERYYVFLFGSQDRTRRPAYTHTWATAVRAVDQPAGPPVLEMNTISWMPATLEINTLSRRVEPGVNLTLDESIANANRTGQ